MLDAGSIKQKNKRKLSMVSLYLGLTWTPRFRDPGSHTRKDCMGAEKFCTMSSLQESLIRR